MARPAIEAPPGLAGQLFGQAYARLSAGRPAEAAALYRQVLSLVPSHPDTLYLSGIAEHRAGRHQAGLDAIERALRARPRSALYHEARGHALRELRRLDDAIGAFRQAVRLDPKLTTAHYNLGLAQQAAGDLDAAAQCYRNALRLDPSLRLARYNLSIVLFDIGALDEAEPEIRQVLREEPGNPEFLNHLGCVLRDLGRLDEAALSLMSVLRQAPDHPDARANLGFTHLLAGRLGQAWDTFGPDRPVFSKPAFDKPLWRGTREPERTILVHPEGGLGDFLHFCRYVPDVARYGRVVVQAPPSLLRLVKCLPCMAELVPADGEPPAFDLVAPIQSLPAILRTSLDTIPATVPYLHPEPAETAAWSERLASLPGLRAGLAWAGNPHYKADRTRSLPPAYLASLAAVPGVSFVSLQKDRTEGVPPALQLHDWTAELHDMAATAALVANLDLVIAIDSAVAHLAGALGRPVWLLNRHNTEWRWMWNRPESPWYPTMRIFRQPALGDWTSVMTHVAAELTRQAQS
jgi:tetratricopeptide (TPR) repeat protein